VTKEFDQYLEKTMPEVFAKEKKRESVYSDIVRWKKL